MADSYGNNWCVYTSNSKSGTSSCTYLASGAYSCKVNPVGAACGDAYTTGSVPVTVVDAQTFTYTSAGSTTTGTNCKITAAITKTTTSTGSTTANTLADAAVYYYLNDLRPTGSLGALGNDVSTNDVPKAAEGEPTTQNMRTFSLGLADGLMTYQPDYRTSSTGDFAGIVAGATGCIFSGGGNNVCNWPAPAADQPSALDDLWHAAVNGRGAYYNARDPESLSEGIYGVLKEVSKTGGAAAASATSSPNVTHTNNYIFSSTYQTSSWDGEVYAEQLDPTTGQPFTSYTTTDPVTGATVVTPYLWSAQTQLDNLVANDATTSKTQRKIFTINTSGAQVDFLYNNLAASQKAYFDNQGSKLFQYAGLTTSNKGAADLGTNLVDYLRGQSALESGPVYRPRTHYLGDTVNATPAYMAAPTREYTDAVPKTYADFQTAQKDRLPMLYIGANDGMLHAFNAKTGAELWAYVPRMVMPNLYQLADTHYRHQYFVDGSPLVSDMYVSAANATTQLTEGWHTLLVAGLNKGGKGFYALDVTDPANPKALWETCNDSTQCVNADINFGYGYGNPVLTKRSIDGKWVVLVTSGYNNDSCGTITSGGVSTTACADGTGYLFELDAMTGQVLRKVSNGSGSTISPSGLAKIGAWVDWVYDNTVRFVYGGDLNGDVWRFDLGAVGASTAITVTKIASLVDSTGKAQPVTTQPELTEGTSELKTPGLGPVDSLLGTGKPVVYLGTGRYLGSTDQTDTSIQSLYAIKDNLSLTGAAASASNTRANMVKQTLYERNGVGGRYTSMNSVPWTTKSGWYLDFDAIDDQTGQHVTSGGERVNIDPVLLLGTLVVATNVPATSSACTFGGTTYLYTFSYKDGTGQGESAASALAVGFVVVRLPSGALKAILTDSTGKKHVIQVGTSGSAEARRASWRELSWQ